MYRPAQRLADISPFHVVELLTRARQLEAEGRDIIHMEVGEPDFPTPAPIANAAVDAINSGKTLYTQSLGLPELRQKISDFYRSRYGVDVPASRIVITNGASGALNLAFACLADPGSKWLLTDPGYPCNRHILRVYEGRPQHIPVGPETNFQPTPALLRQHWNARTAGLLVASPANPTGTLLTLAEIKALAETCRELEGHFLVDEIYHGLTYAPKEGPLGDEIDTPTACAAGDDIWVIARQRRRNTAPSPLSSRQPSPSLKLAEPSFASAGISSHPLWSALASGLPPARKVLFISIAIARDCATTASCWPETCSKRWALPPHPVWILAVMPRKSISALPTPQASTVWPRLPSD